MVKMAYFPRGVQAKSRTEAKVRSRLKSHVVVAGVGCCASRAQPHLHEWISVATKTFQTGVHGYVELKPKDVQLKPK